MLWVLAALCVGSGGCARLQERPYPIGLFSVSNRGDLPVIADAGFSCVSGPAERGFLDAARDAGVGVLAYPGTAAGPAFSAQAARGAIAACDPHPALWAWLLADEPDLARVEPDRVREAHRFFKREGARKPTAVVFWQGHSSGDYGRIADISMVDHYPIPWLPLANFGQHVRMARLGCGPRQPLIAVIQAFDWGAHPERLPEEKNLRPPTLQEMRCMAYAALAEGADGLFFYAWADGKWILPTHPETWSALRRVVTEIRERSPLFEAEHRWWGKDVHFGEYQHRFNAALLQSVTSTLLRVSKGNASVPAGDYILAVNTTDREQEYGFTLPDREVAEVGVFGESRSIPAADGWVADGFPPYGVRIYGPLKSSASQRRRR